MFTDLYSSFMAKKRFLKQDQKSSRAHDTPPYMLEVHKEILHSSITLAPSLRDLMKDSFRLCLSPLVTLLKTCIVSAPSPNACSCLFFKLPFFFFFGG